MSESMPKPTSPRHAADRAPTSHRRHGRRYQSWCALAVAFGDAGYTEVAKRPERKLAVDWHVAMKPGKRRALGKTRLDRLYEKIERLKAQVRARGEHAFRVVKRQFGYVKVRYRGLAKNT